MTRREFGSLPLAAWAPDSRVSGVRIGAQSYSFRDRPLAEAVDALRQVGLTVCELWQGHVEPRTKDREELRRWRTSTPLDHFQDVRRRFRDAGIDLYAYNYSFRDDFSDEEIARGFEMARAMRVKALTASATVSAARRVAPYSLKHKVVVAMHNHSNVKDPNEFATPESFEQALDYSRYFAINLDVGHFFAAGFDPVAFIEKHHSHIVTLHLKDRKANQGSNVPFGEGDTPVKEVLLLLRKNKYRIPAMIEYEYKGGDAIAEVRRCYEYCKQALS